MVSEHDRYVRDSKSKDDKKQSKFDKSGWLQKSKPEVTAVFTSVSGNELVMCPFCLYTSKLSLFFVSTKKGISQHDAKCPECHNGMRMTSLWNEWSPEEYAEFVYPYARSGFWQKCPFQTWSKRLRAIGWSYRFWARYKALKGEDTTESYFDYMERQAQEYAEEHSGYMGDET